MTEGLKPCSRALCVCGVPLEIGSAINGGKHVGFYFTCPACMRMGPIRPTTDEAALAIAICPQNARVDVLQAENDRLKARIAELEKAREVLDTGWVIVDGSQSSVCYTVPALASDAWEAFTTDQQSHEAKGYRAVKVAVVRVEE